MSEQNRVLLWQAVIAGCVTLGLGAMSNRTHTAVERVANAQDVAAVEVHQVKTDLKKNETVTTAKLETIAKVGRETKAFVNGAMENQLTLQKDTAEAKAEITNDPVDLKAAELAKQALDLHKKADEENRQPPTPKEK